jgi:hypothetical protein
MLDQWIHFTPEAVKNCTHRGGRFMSSNSFIRLQPQVLSLLIAMLRMKELP